jgi:DNA-directed RNA polymerase subunit alpha
MAFKSFGETTMSEIKTVLSKRGLRLGQKPEEIDVAAVEAAPVTVKPTIPPGSEAIMSRPVSEIELSVRSRRCLQRLNIVTLGDLIQHSEADLLATRNFGHTSLNEIKAKLIELGLNLATRK